MEVRHGTLVTRAASAATTTSTWCLHIPSTPATTTSTTTSDHAAGPVIGNCHKLNDHQQHFQASQNQVKTLETIASMTGFANTFGSNPIYNGKDKSACAEWLHHVKEGSFQTRFNFSSTLIQRDTHDVAEVIRSLDDDMTHDQITQEIMCCFSGIPSTAATIDEPSHMRQQPRENLCVYIHKWKELH